PCPDPMTFTRKPGSSLPTAHTTLEIAMNRNVPAESDTYVYDGARVRVLRSGTQTNGVFALLEATLPPGAMAAPHSHAHEEETPYVLEGTLYVETQGRTIALSPGETAILPRN